MIKRYSLKQHHIITIHKYIDFLESIPTQSAPAGYHHAFLPKHLAWRAKVQTTPKQQLKHTGSHTGLTNTR